MSDFKGIGDWHHKAKVAEGDYEPPDISLYDDIDLDSIEPEEKSVVRHVRTPEGVIKYDQPIGSVIVRDPIDLPHSKFPSDTGSDIHPATTAKKVPYIKPAKKAVPAIFTKKGAKKKVTQKGIIKKAAAEPITLSVGTFVPYTSHSTGKTYPNIMSLGWDNYVTLNDDVFMLGYDLQTDNITIKDESGKLYGTSKDLAGALDILNELGAATKPVTKKAVPVKKKAVKKPFKKAVHQKLQNLRFTDFGIRDDDDNRYRIAEDDDGLFYAERWSSDTHEWVEWSSDRFMSRTAALRVLDEEVGEGAGVEEPVAQADDPTTRWTVDDVPEDELGILHPGYEIEQINTAYVAGVDRVQQVHLFDPSGTKWTLERSSFPPEWRLFDSNNDLVSRDRLSVLFGIMDGKQALKVPIKLRYMKFVGHEWERDTYAPINAKEPKAYGPGSVEIERTGWSTGAKYIVTTYEARVPFETVKDAFLFADLYTGVNHGDMNVAELNKAKKAMARLTGFKSTKYDLLYQTSSNTVHVNVKTGDTTTILTVQKVLSMDFPYMVSTGGYTFQGMTVDAALDKAVKFASTPLLNTAVTPEDLKALRAQGFAQITDFDNYRQTWRAPNHTKIRLYIDQEGRYAAMSYATDEVVTAETPRAALEALYKGEQAAQEEVRAKIRSLSRVGKDAALAEDKTPVGRSTIVGFVPSQNDFDGKMFIQKGFEEFKRKDDWGLGLVTIEGSAYGERRIPRQEYAQKLLEALTPEERSNLEHMLGKIERRWGLNSETRIEEQEGWLTDEKRAAQLLQFGHDAWADSASNPFAVKVQSRVARMFGTHPYLDHIGWSIDEYQRREKESGWTGVDDSTLDALVRTVYEATQNELVKRGVDTMRLARGMPINSGVHGVEDANQQALVSYSTDEDRAREFGTPMYVEVPRERIFSVSWLTGMGSAYEDEVVVIGNSNDQAFFNLGKERTW